MPLPADFHDEGTYYRTRISLRFEDDPMIGLLNHSIIGVCDDCGEAIWINEQQELPPMPEGMELSGDVILCFQCFKRIAGEDEVSTLTEQTTEHLREMGFNAKDPLT